MASDPDDPRTIRRDTAYERAAEELSDDLGREPTDEEIDNYLDQHPDPPDVDWEPDEF